jgi:hypothetical protein
MSPVGMAADDFADAQSGDAAFVTAKIALVSPNLDRQADQRLFTCVANTQT